jgi:hypothetical protein
VIHPAPIIGPVYFSCGVGGATLFLMSRRRYSGSRRVSQHLGRELQRPPRRLPIDMGCVRVYLDS